MNMTVWNNVQLWAIVAIFVLLFLRFVYQNVYQKYRSRKRSTTATPDNNGDGDGGANNSGGNSTGSANHYGLLSWIVNVIVIVLAIAFLLWFINTKVWVDLIVGKGAEQVTPTTISVGQVAYTPSKDGFRKKIPTDEMVIGATYKLQASTCWEQPDFRSKNGEIIKKMVQTCGNGIGKITFKNAETEKLPPCSGDSYAKIILFVNGKPQCGQKGPSRYTFQENDVLSLGLNNFLTKDSFAIPEQIVLVILKVL